MKLVLVALYDMYSTAIRGLHSFSKEVLGYETASLYLMESTYTDGLLGMDALLAVVAKTRELDPEFVGIGVRSPLFLLFARLCQEIRAVCPDTKIIAGGPHAEGDPESCLRFADYVVTGDGEPALEDILPGGYNGLVHHGRVADLDPLPFQHYGDNTFLFLSAAPRGATKVSAYSQRGCPFSCTYCQESISRKKPVRMTAARLRGEVDHLRGVFPKMKQLSLADSVFLRGQSWMNDFAAEFEGCGIDIWCWGYAPLVTDDILLAAKAGGVKHVRIGVQSGSDRLRRDILGRRDTVEQVRAAAALIEKHGLTAHYDFIIENPYDTPDTMRETRALIRELSPAPINKFELRYWPGTKITEMALQDGYIVPEDIEGNYCRFGDWSYAYQQHNGERAA